MNEPLRVLHLEDDPSDSEIVRCVLEADGLRCSIARVDCGTSFSAALEAGGFDIILADFSLPGFDGLSALSLASERRPQVPFIFVSGTLGEEVAIDALKIGATDYVLKERLSRLPSAVVRALREARAREDRLRAEQQLRRSEAFLAEGQRISRTGSWYWTRSTGEVIWSHQQYRLLGLEPGEVTPSLKLFLTVIHPEDRAFVAGEIEHATAAGTGYAVAYRVIQRDGTMRHLQSVGSPAKAAAGADEYIGTTTDITDRVHAEATLLARQQMLDLAQSAAGAAAFEWCVGAGTGRCHVSPGLEAMYGVPRGTYDGSLSAWKRIVHADDLPAAEAALRRAAVTGDFSVEYRVAHGEQPRWLQAKARMFFDDIAQPVRVVGFMLDITERKSAEEQLKRLESRLRQVQRLEAVGTLAGGIAHDFNNILAAILGYGERALDGAAPGSRIRHDLEQILAAGERGRALVERVLTFSRPGSGSRGPVCVEKVVREALDLVAGRQSPGIRIEASLNAGKAAVRGDATQIHQVLMNLATNAIQAMPQGGRLRVGLGLQSFGAARQATIGTISPGDYVVLEVTDSGTGIDPEAIDRLFDPFFTTRELKGGTGLGLSLVHGVVTDMDAAIELSSRLGAGTTFLVYFPRHGVADEAPGPDLRPAHRGNGQRVLFVDDEEPLVHLATDTLENLGYLPVGFTSSEAALAAFRSDPKSFDVVITDERMPGLSGSDLIREVRSLDASVPILLLSGYLGAAAAERAYNTGVSDVLRKPLLSGDLAASLARVLRH